MSEAFIQHSLASDTILDVRFLIFEKTEGDFFGNFSKKITVKCLNYPIVSYAANHEVIIRVIIAPTTFSDKFKPFPVVCVKFKNFPFRKNALKFITIQPSLLFTTNKALTIFFSLFTY